MTILNTASNTAQSGAHGLRAGSGNGAGTGAGESGHIGEVLLAGAGVDPFVFGITVLILACFVGYYVVWQVTPALHSPLMGVTNAISSVIIVGALIAAGPDVFDTSRIMGLVAVFLASVNIFGGFIVTARMLAMFKSKGPGR